MKKIDNFTNLYSVSKTIKFRLIPIGKTEENFKIKYLASDVERSDNYQKVKSYFDRYHKAFIEDVLKEYLLPETLLQQYYQNTIEKNEEELTKIKDELRKNIAKAFSDGKFKDEFNQLFSASMVEKLLPSILNDDEKKIEAKFLKFTTYFTGFNQNRKNIYSADNKHSTIGYRLIDENLPKFCLNINNYKKIAEKLDANDLLKLNDNMSQFKVSTDVLCNVVMFNKTLSQSGIDTYNKLIGGFSLEDGTKVQGINELVNLYNQQNKQTDKLPYLVPLYKQVLSDSEKIDFSGTFKNDEELIEEITNNYAKIEPETNRLRLLIKDIDLYEEGIAISTSKVNDYSSSVYGAWDYIVNGYISYNIAKQSKKVTNCTEEDYKNKFKKRKSYLVSELVEFAQANSNYEEIEKSFINNIKTAFNAYIDDFNIKYNAFKEYKTNKSICKDDSYVQIIKEYLDSVKTIEWQIKSLSVDEVDAKMNSIFYSILIEIYSKIVSIDKLYNKVRNYVTKKQYSDSKIKLNFDNPQFLNGWDKNKEDAYKSVLLRDDKYYYLGIIDKANAKVFLNYDSNGKACYEKMEYKLLPGPNKMLPKVFFSKKNASQFDPLGEMTAFYKMGTFKKGKKFNQNDLWKLIDFYKDAIAKHSDWKKYNFNFKETKEYEDISQFYNDISEQGYMINFVNVSKEYVDSLVNDGKLYLFKIYNKDFSEYSKGNMNLHTMYFKACFEKENLSDIVYKLNGGCEMFYRPASIQFNVTHPANNPINNKNKNNKKVTSTFNYDLVKDKRYSEDQFFIHLPITMNYKSSSKKLDLNSMVKDAIKKTENNYIIGIDRGERNLIYLCVIDEKGNIIEQESLNKIVSGDNYIVDYHRMLDEKEDERKQSRQNWQTINSIKEIKEGYLSQVVHKICEYVIKYDAIISLENLNSGFKNSRVKVEKQVYDKFENMLINKLNYMIVKNANNNLPGGIYKAYQLTMSKSSDNQIQNGIIFKIPAWLTSKIDPITGFANQLRIKYKSIEESKDYINNFDDISYDKNKDYFKFKIDYSKFGANVDAKKKWTICTYGERILTFRNKEKNNNWDNKEINLTLTLKKLFDEYQINYNEALKSQIIAQTDKSFFVRFFDILKLTLQMRNSVTGNGDIDYIISPVEYAEGKFYDSRKKDIKLPLDADANGAYNIARKTLMIIKRIKEANDLTSVEMSIKNADWLEFAQKNE